MFYQTRIKLTRPMLGDLCDDSKVFRFRKHPDNEEEIIIPEDHWKWAVSEAVDSLKLGQVDKKCMHSMVHLYAPTRTMYRRNYRRNGEQAVATHEAIPTNYEMTFDMFVTAKPPIGEDSPLSKGKFSPSMEEMEQIMKFIGMFIGISPFGSHRGYGRYKLLQLEERVPTL